MDTFQKVINPSLGVAVPGTIVEALSSHSLVQEGKSADAFVTLGKFVFAGATGGEITGRASAGAAPLGVAINSRYFSGSMDSLGQSVPVGETVAYLQRGVIAVIAPAVAPSVDQDVLVDPATGVITTGAASGTAIATGWVVRQAAPAGGIMFIQK